MFNFVSLSIKCPECGESLMDSNHLVDNEPSIKLLIQAKGKKGVINLSSIYDSYNFYSDIDLPSGEIIELSCPHCKAMIKDSIECNICDAPMKSLHLDMGGKVSICPRIGCKNHFVEFEDLSLALKKLYQEHAYGGVSHSRDNTEVRKKTSKAEKRIDEATETIESGTFMQVYCPHCKKSLIENEILKLSIDNNNKEKGEIFLSPYLNIFTSKSTIYLAEDEPIAGIRCFHCNTSLIEEKKKCEECGSSIAKLSVSARSKVIDFYICSKKGCRWHGLNTDDLNEIRLDNSLNW